MASKSPTLSMETDRHFILEPEFYLENRNQRFLYTPEGILSHIIL